MILDRGNPYEQAVRRECDHANAGPDLDGLSYEEARMAVARWNAPPPLFKRDAFPTNVCPDCGEEVGIYLSVAPSGPR